MNNLLISKIYFKEFHNVFAFLCFSNYASIKELSLVSPQFIRNLLFDYARSRCDTTSAIYNKHNTETIKLVECNTKFIQDISAVFKDTFATKEQVSFAGIQLSKRLYGK